MCIRDRDYLQEGINLRAMGQKDPLAEWQREGFDMVSAMMGGIQDNFVRYVSHLQVVTEEQQVTPTNLQYTASEDPVQGSQGLQAAAAAMPAEEMALAGGGPAPAPVPAQEAPMEPVKVDKTPGRNEPCYCGSGKKFKHCHGR